MRRMTLAQAIAAAVILGAASLLPCGRASAQATQPADYAIKTPDDPKTIDWIQALRTKVKPLTHARNGRWPMILWENVPFEPQAPEVYRDELARGFVPHIRLDEKMIPAAKAIADAGGTVIMMQGAGGTFPYDRAGDPSLWAHQIPKDFAGPKEPHACIAVIAGWQVEAQEIRRILKSYKDAGVTVSAVWMDWEGEPLYLDEASYEQAKVCPRCRATLPAGVLDNYRNYKRYGNTMATHLLGAYLAAPVEEIFPGCSTTNWASVNSTPGNPLQMWANRKYEPRTVSFFTATNPVAYGNTDFFNSAAREESPSGEISRRILDPKAAQPSRDEVDRIYTNILLRHVSGSQRNTDALMPWVRSVPWVCRWCPDDENPRLPIMSRERYREALRHIWLRGAIGMQVFAATRPGYSPIVVGELEDASLVYDQSLEWTDYINHGTCMNLDIPGPTDDGPVWSGMRLADSAVVRAFKQGPGEASVTIAPWPDRPALKVTLNAPQAGATYFLKADGDKVGVTVH